MKAQNGTYPDDVKIKLIGERECEIILAGDVIEVVEEDRTYYEYHEYKFTTIYREGLSEKIKSNVARYLEFAKEKVRGEKQAEILRQLAELDKVVTRVEEDLIEQLKIELHPKKLEVIAKKQALRQELAEL
jgi:homoserine trans-succinylase